MYDIKIRLVRDMPETISGIMFDALNSLRSSLDQATYDIATASGKNGRYAKFPFGDNLADAENLALRTGRSIQKPIFDMIINTYKPYKEGNNALWALNKLCNSHKHEIVLPTAIANGFATISFGGMGLSFIPEWDIFKREISLGSFRDPNPPNESLNVTAYIAIAKTDVMYRRPVLEYIRDVSRIVEDIITGLEAEAVRLGILHK